MPDDKMMRTSKMPTIKFENLYQGLMRLGKYSGCHQLANRSFFFGARQFPVCARCTGVFFGNLAAICLFFLYRPHWAWLVWGCAILFLDWLIQYIGVLRSTNIRRLITGIIGGYALNSLYIWALQTLLRAVFSYLT